MEPIKETKPVRFKSSYLVLRHDGTRVRDDDFINDDPKDRWAEVDARGAINTDAGRKVGDEEIAVTVFGAR